MGFEILPPAKSPALLPMKYRIVILLLVGLLTACRSTQSPVFSDQCAAPCWRQIEPGKTDSSGALSTIKSFSDIDLRRISISGPWNIFSGFIHFELTSGETIRIYMIDGFVVLIDFYNPKGITFGDCVDEFGFPEYVAQSSTLGPGLPILPASDAEHIWLNALSPSKGIVYSYDMYNVWFGSNFNLAQNTIISSIRFFDPKQYEKLLENGFLISNDTGGLSPGNLYQWNGYGNINELYPEK